MLTRLALFFSIGISVASAQPPGTCPLGPIAGIDDPRVAFRSRPGQALPLSLNDSEWPSVRGRLVRELAPRVANDPKAPQMSIEEYERRALGFAQDAADHRNVTFTTRGASNSGTKIRMNLSTGELLITDGKDRLSIYTRLPVGERPVGRFKSTYEWMNHLTENVTHAAADGRVESWPRLVAGEAVKTTGFRHYGDMKQHFLKHIIRAGDGESLAAVYEGINDRPPKARYQSDNAVMRAQFFRDWIKLKADPGAVDALVMRYAEQYEKEAKAFAASTSPQALTYTKVVKNGSGRENVLALRFDPVTKEFAVIDRESGVLVSYYRVHQDMVAANEQLKFHGLPPVRDALEYFLSIASDTTN